MDHRQIRAHKLKEFRDKITSHLGKFSDQVLETVEYRASLDPTPDGFPTNTRYGPRTGGEERHGLGCEAAEGGTCTCEMSDGPEVSTTTERAVLQLIDGRKDRDPQQKACERIDMAFRTIWRELDAAEHAWDVILNASDSIRTREAQSTLGTCQACLRDDIPNVGNDRIRSGYCHPCYAAWYRTDKGHGKEDRLSFELGRRQMYLVRGGYQVDELDALVKSGALPMHARIEPEEAV